MQNLLTILLLSIIVSTSTVLKAQHCEWDMTHIIIVDIHDSVSGQVINGLEIVLTDSTGKPYTNEWNLMSHREHFTFYQNTDTLKFGQNLQKKSQELTQAIRPFPVGLGDYMLMVFDNYSANAVILIKDIDREKNLGYFETKSVKLGRENIVSLCVENSIWKSEEAVNKVKITVTLKQKQ